MDKQQEYVKKMEKEHPDPNCPMRKYATLHYIGEPRYSIVNGKVVYDKCTCKK